MVACAVVQANQCPGSGECQSNDEPLKMVSLLQAKLDMNVIKAGGEAKHTEPVVEFEQSTSLKDHEHVKLANPHLLALAQLLDGMQSLEPHNQGQIHAPESSSWLERRSKEHQRIVVHSQESFVYNGTFLFDKEWKPTIAPSQLPRVLHVTCKDKFSFSQKHSWTVQNPGWSIDFLTDERIEGLFRSQFPTKDLEQVAKLGVEKADIGRLLALQVEGGVYVDSDVEDLVPIEKWPEPYNYEMKDIDVILGVEFPYAAAANPLQITNWAMAAKPGNSLIRHVLAKIVEDAPSIPDIYSNIISRTGPGALTSALLSVFQGYGLKLPLMSEFNGGQGHLFSLPERDGQMMKVLILPYRAFGYCKAHGDDVVKTPEEQRLVKHWFAGSWKHL